MPAAALSNAELLDELAQRRAEHGTIFYFEFNEDQVMDLASGYVPNVLKATFKAALDWDEEDKRRAERPVKVKRAK